MSPQIRVKVSLLYVGVNKDRYSERDRDFQKKRDKPLHIEGKEFVMLEM